MRKFFTFLICSNLFVLSAFAQITGTVYRDYNLDGTYQPGPPFFEIGIENVIINAYDGTNTVIATTTSAANGSYTLPFTVPVRIEFEMSTPTLCVDSSVDFSSYAIAGDNIRIVTAASNNVDYGIHDPKDYVVTADPYIYISRFNRGDPLLPGTAATAPALYGYLYSSTNFTPTFTAQAGPLGSVWGLAYSRQAKKVFASAFLKRQSGLGPLGSGGIYLCEPTGTSFTITNFYDMDANGHRTRAAATAAPYGVGSTFTINAAGTEATYIGPIDPVSGLPEGLGVIGVNGPGGRGLTPSTTDQWNDPAAVDQVAKVGLGDIDISTDGRFLFVTNLYSRLVYRLQLDNAYNPTSVVAVDSFALPAVTVNNGLLRCFGLAYHRGKLYIGAVTTGENGGQNVVNGATDLFAYVFEMENPLLPGSTINATPVITFPLNYLKGAVIGGSGTQWFPWNKITNILLGGEEHLPTPILSDIEFSDRGDMIMNFCDRTGHQFSGNSRQDLTGTNMCSSVDIGGDILIAGVDCNTGNFTLENNAAITSNGTPFVTLGANNNQGVGGGEFFYNDEWSSFHFETSVGSCGVLRGRGQVVVSLMDPVTAFSNGAAKFSTTDGLNFDNLSMATTAEFGKANSMGDIEVAGDAANLQIGNRVWRDENANGIQDPDELGVADVSIELLADFDNDGIPDGGALATTLTNNAGYFYFDHTNVPDGDPQIAGAQVGPVPHRYYLLRVAPPDWAAGAGINDLAGFSLTVAQVGGPGQPDVRDNDAEMLNAIPTIRLYSKRSGENTHTWDFGFIPCPLVPPGDITLNCDNPALPIGPAPLPGATYYWTPPTGLSATDVSQPIASGTTTTTYTLTINNLCTYVFTAYVDNNPPEADAGVPRILDCETPTTVIGSPAIGGNTYSWSPGNTLDDSTKAQPVASPTVTTQYTVTVTGTNGCTKQDMVTINKDICCSRIVIPNSFTPNEDKLNDGFGVVVIENVESFYLTIYNRYGERVFETEDPQVKWDGKYKDKVADVGVYYYYIKYNCQNFTKPRFIKGDITLIR